MDNPSLRSFSGTEDASLSTNAAELDAWARYGNMGKGLGGGLSRTVSSMSGTREWDRERERGRERGSERGSEAERGLRRAGGGGGGVCK